MEENKKKEISLKIGKKIYEQRKKLKLTREKLAEKCNLSAHYIYYLENGEYLPGCSAIIDICNTLEITPTQLLSSELNLNINNFIETISDDFQKLSDYDKKLLIEIIKTMADMK